MYLCLFCVCVCVCVCVFACVCMAKIMECILIFIAKDLKQYLPHTPHFVAKYKVQRD